MSYERNTRNLKALAALALMLVLCTGWAAGSQTAARPVLASIQEES